MDEGIGRSDSEGDVVGRMVLATTGVKGPSGVRVDGDGIGAGDVPGGPMKSMGESTEFAGVVSGLRGT